MKLIEHFKLIPTHISIPTSHAICNPSIVATPEGWSAIVRVLDPLPFTTTDSPYLSSENWLIRYDDYLRPQSRTLLNDAAVRFQYHEARNGLEDGRIFLWRGNTWILFSGLERSGKEFLNTMILTRLEDSELVDAIVLPSPHQRVREKNWMPWVLDDDLYLVYSTRPMEIYRMEENALIRVHGNEYLQHNTAAWVSGSSQVIPWGDDFLAVTHQRSRAPVTSRLTQKYLTRDPEYQKKKVHFSHRLILLDRNFNIKSCSRTFRFETDGIEFCAGIAAKGSQVLIAYGVMDQSARLIELDKAEIDGLLGATESSRSMARIAPPVRDTQELPSVDAIVLNYRNFSSTAALCLDSLQAYFNSERVRVRLLDNGSPDNSCDDIREYAKVHPGLTYECLPNNLGFAGGMNYAAAKGCAEWLLLINSDTVFLPDSLDRLSQAMASAAPDVAALGPVTNAAGNEQDYPLGTDRESALIAASKLHQNPLQRMLPVYRLDFFCVAVRRTVWQALCGLDVSYGPGYYEDFDFSVRARQAGYKLMMSEDAFVYHRGGGTFKQSKSTKQLIRRNRDLFTSRFPGVDLPHKRDGNLQVLKLYGELLASGFPPGRLAERINLRLAALSRETPKGFLKRRQWKKKLIALMNGKLANYKINP